jgi:AcrR family transcriptional regulator
MTLDQADRAMRGGQATGGRLLSSKGQRTRAALITAASQIFEATPFGDVRLADITAKAGVSAGTFYTYFDSKEQIFREVSAGVLSEMSESGRLDPTEAAEDPITALANATRRYFLTCLRHAGVARSMEQQALTDPEVSRSRRGTVITGVKRTQRFIQQLQSAGICDDGINSWDMAMVLHTMTVRVAYDHLLLTGDEGHVDRLVNAVTHAWARAVGLERLPPRVGVSS